MQNPGHGGQKTATSREATAVTTDAFPPVVSALGFGVDCTGTTRVDAQLHLSISTRLWPADRHRALRTQSAARARPVAHIRPPPNRDATATALV